MVEVTSVTEKRLDAKAGLHNPSKGPRYPEAHFETQKAPAHSSFPGGQDLQVFVLPIEFLAQMEEKYASPLPPWETAVYAF